MNAPDRQDTCVESVADGHGGDRNAPSEPDERVCPSCRARGRLAPLVRLLMELLEKFLRALDGRELPVPSPASLLDPTAGVLTSATPARETRPAAEGLWKFPQVAEYLDVTEDHARALIKKWAPEAPGLFVTLGPRSARVNPVILREHLVALGPVPPQRAAEHPASGSYDDGSYDDGLFDLRPLRRTPR